MGQNFPALKLGILGGGQLARMLVLQAHNLGVQAWVLSSSPQDPAAQVTQFWMQGSPQLPHDVEAFFQKVDIVTFESEFLDAFLLQELAEKYQRPVLPNPKLMGILQDRLTQKQSLLDHRLPTAHYVVVNNVKEAHHALREFGGEMILKQRRMGYDGYGTFPIRKPSDIDAIAEKIEQTVYGFIAEERIRFRRELAVMAARRSSGQKIIFPFVESYQQDSRCLWVCGPVKSNAAARLSPKLFKFLDRLDYVGIMGFELFETSRGLLINELAPRVHNSGHYSLEGLAEDQFMVHLKAVLNMELSRVQLQAKGFAMMNLLGEKIAQPNWHLPAGVHLHWYGKDRSEKGRKMGHYTILANSPRSALALAKKTRRNFQV